MGMRPYKKIQMGTGKQRAGTVGGLLQVSTTQFAVADGTAVAGATFTLRGGALAKNGDGVRVQAWGSFAADADAGTVNIRFGGLSGTVVATVAKTNAGLWTVIADIFRTGAATQKSLGRGHVSNTAQDTQTQATPAQTLAADVSVVVELDGTNANDIVLEGAFMTGLANPA